MPDTVINLLIQLPLVGIFVFFILEWSRRNDHAVSRRDEEWRDFLKEERAHRAEAISRLAEEIKSVAQQVNQMSGLLSAHDAASREARLTSRRGTSELKPKD